MMHPAGPSQSIYDVSGAAQAASAAGAVAGAGNAAINTAGMSATSAAAVAAASGLPNLARLAEPPAYPPHIGEAIMYHTQGTHHKGVFRWVIDNYSHLPQKPKKRTFTKEFQLCGYKWQLSVTPGGEKSDSTEAFMSVYLWYHGTEEIETAATIQLIDLNEHDRCVFCTQVSTPEWPSFHLSAFAGAASPWAREMFPWRARACWATAHCPVALFFVVPCSRAGTRSSTK
jgi:hypothetical protein